MSYIDQVKELLEKINSSDAILIGAASGMSAAAGYKHYYVRDEQFIKSFGAFEKKYGFHSSFDGYYYHYPSIEAQWGFESTFVTTIYDEPVGQPYKDLLALLKGKNYHILTTNQDLQFLKAGEPEERVSQIQGEWRFLQCARRCHDKLYDAVEPMRQLAANIDENLCVPKEMIPKCPKCGSYMTQWVRSYEFLEGKRYKKEYQKTNEFIQKNKNGKILFLELGVGRMTPMFIQEPFWNLTYALPKAYYITINPKDAILPRELSNKGLAIKEDIAKVFHDAVEVQNGAE